MFLELIIVSLVILWPIVLLYSYDKKRKADERKKNKFTELNFDRNFFVKLAKDSAMKFGIAGSLAVLAYWMQIDWGTYSVILLTIFDYLRGKIEEAGKKDDNLSRENDLPA